MIKKQHKNIKKGTTNLEKMSTHEKLTAKRSYTTVHLFEKDILLNTEVFKCKCRSFLLPERNKASIIFALSFNVFLLNKKYLHKT